MGKSVVSSLVLIELYEVREYLKNILEESENATILKSFKIDFVSDIL